jgi:phage gpG-like protein
MAIPEIDVRVFGEMVIRRRLTRLASRMTDQREGFQQVVRILREATAENFRTRGASGGVRWPDLNEEYAARTNRSVGERILRLTERLYGSLVGAAPGATAARGLSGRFIAGGADHIEEITRDSLRWGSRVEYGVYHQSSAPRKVIPYRPPVRLQERQKREIVRALQRAMME